MHVRIFEDDDLVLSEGVKVEEFFFDFTARTAGLLGVLH